ncbi:Rieske 2Fe-2S domain-containing protein [Segetibacter koreensis]|uniref:Rieske 2Fe-2S domain-containing protein n=1 Tax=Segetibacter koreensis TaxID=398037 RepID=UPI00037289EE|nr:Rieske 2Fe-2S domain-containing protein [Segetibacter koreensis]
MNEKTITNYIDEQQWLDDAGNALQPAIIKAYKSGGEAGQKLKNFMHGTWLGHPLHPVITDVPVGAYTATAVLDVLELAGHNKYSAGADVTLAVGLVGALGSAATGLTDWSATSGKGRKVGLVHGLLNVGATALYATSFFLRRGKGSRNTAIGLALVGYGISAAAAYLGGHLVFGEQIGVDHTATAAEYPVDFIAVLPENELADNSMRCVQAGEVPVLLARKNNKIFAIAHTCSHFGGPLSEGDLLENCSVRCPWHGSVFSLEDGSVINGPASEPQPKFDVRINNGQIEVRKAT